MNTPVSPTVNSPVNTLLNMHENTLVDTVLNTLVNTPVNTRLAIVVSACSLRGFMIPAICLCGSYAGFFLLRFLQHFVSALWAFVLFNSIALLKTIMRDAGGSPSAKMGGSP